MVKEYTLFGIYEDLRHQICLPIKANVDLLQIKYFRF